MPRLVAGALLLPHMAGQLRCRFGLGGASSTTAATFVSSAQVACARPAYAGPPADVPLTASHDGGDAFSETAARLTFYDARHPTRAMPMSHLRIAM